MKATLDIPDHLYRQVKAKSAMEGSPIRLVAINLFSAWVNGVSKDELKKTAEPVGIKETGPAWFGVAKPYALKVKRHDMDAVRESLSRKGGES
jgi:hypothetical protein